MSKKPNTTPWERSEGETDKTGASVLCPDVTVDDSGRVRIPKKKREMYDIEPGTVLDVVVGTDQDVSFPCTGRRVDGEGRVHIPARQRRKYDIDAGDYVDLVLVMEA